MVIDNFQEMIVADTVQMEEFGRTLGVIVQSLHLKAITIFLEGDLGAGKTTLARGFVQSFGYLDKIKSPTFTIVEVYEIASNLIGDNKIYHFDLYRINDEHELESMGFRDYFAEDAFRLIEWPSKLSKNFINVDLKIIIEYLDDGRLVKLQPLSLIGTAVMEKYVK